MTNIMEELLKCIHVKDLEGIRNNTLHDCHLDVFVDDIEVLKILLDKQHYYVYVMYNECRGCKHAH